MKQLSLFDYVFPSWKFEREIAKISRALVCVDIGFMELPGTPGIPNSRNYGELEDPIFGTAWILVKTRKEVFP